MTLAADLSDTSAESSLSALVEPESDSSADNSAAPSTVEDRTDLPTTDGTASSQGSEAEVSASLDDDVGDTSAPGDGAASAITRPVLRMTTTALRGTSDGEEEAEAPEADEVDPYADDGAGEGGQAEDVAGTETENLTTQSEGNGDAVPTVSLNSEAAGVRLRPPAIVPR